MKLAVYALLLIICVAHLKAEDTCSASGNQHYCYNGVLNYRVYGIDSNCGSDLFSIPFFISKYIGKLSYFLLFGCVM